MTKTHPTCPICGDMYGAMILHSNRPPIMKMTYRCQNNHETEMRVITAFEVLEDATINEENV